jgi:hypothetical protein
MCDANSLGAPRWRIAAFLAISALLCTGGCRDELLPTVSVARRVEPKCPVPERPEDLFPSGAFFDVAPADDSRRAWHSQFLRAVDAAALWCGAEGRETYRMLWIPSFAFATPIVVTVTDNPNSWTAAGAQFPALLPSSSARVLGLPTARSSRSITTAEADELRTALDATGFWNTRSQLSPETDDGSAWTIEARRGERYHVVTRQNNGGPAFEEAARLFARLAGLDVPPAMKPKR